MARLDRSVVYLCTSEDVLPVIRSPAPRCSVERPMSVIYFSIDRHHWKRLICNRGFMTKSSTHRMRASFVLFRSDAIPPKIVKVSVKRYRHLEKKLGTK